MSNVPTVACTNCGKNFTTDDLRGTSCKFCGTLLAHHARAQQQVAVVNEMMADRNGNGIPDMYEGVVANAQANAMNQVIANNPYAAMAMAPAHRQCGACGSNATPANMRFCRGCGADMGNALPIAGGAANPFAAMAGAAVAMAPAHRQCPSCGSTATPGHMKFCMGCGAAMESMGAHNAMNPYANPYANIQMAQTVTKTAGTITIIILVSVMLVLLLSVGMGVAFFAMAR